MGGDWFIKFIVNNPQFIPPLPPFSEVFSIALEISAKGVESS